MSKDKTIIRVRKEANFVIVSRFPLEDERLTWEARGLYGFLLAKPDNWQISLNHLTKSSPAGYDKTKRILKELLGFKYIRKEEHRNQRGQFSYPAYTIYELPYDGHFTAVANPPTVKPPSVASDAESPAAVDPQLIKKQDSKDTNKTTTTTKQYIWPDNLTLEDRASIAVIAENEDPEMVQVLLYEIKGTTEFKKSPVSLFCFLMKLHKENRFVSAAAHYNKSKHEAKARGELNYQLMLEDSEKRAIALFEQESKS